MGIFLIFSGFAIIFLAILGVAEFQTTFVWKVWMIPLSFLLIFNGFIYILLKNKLDNLELKLYEIEKSKNENI